MNDAGWISTTHDWSLTVDHAHPAAIRSAADAHAPGGALHLLHEVLAHVADEAEATGAAAARWEVTLFADRSVAVRDHGRGTDTRHDAAGGAVRKPVVATRDLRLFDHAGVETLPDGHPRRGMSVVAALSDWLLHENRTLAGSWRQRYERGVPVTDLQELAPDGTTGTLVRFRPDEALAPVPADGLAELLSDGGPVLAVEVLDDREVLP